MFCSILDIKSTFTSGIAFTLNFCLTIGLIKNNFQQRSKGWLDPVMGWLLFQSIFCQPYEIKLQLISSLALCAENLLYHHVIYRVHTVPFNSLWSFIKWLVCRTVYALSAFWLDCLVFQQIAHMYIILLETTRQWKAYYSSWQFAPISQVLCVWNRLYEWFYLILFSTQAEKTNKQRKLDYPATFFCLSALWETVYLLICDYRTFSNAILYPKKRLLLCLWLPKSGV